jgi:flagellar hook-associated protein 1 FlgK
MGTITSLINIAQQALLADQAGLNATANNVANQTTVGYTRETVSTTAVDVVNVNDTTDYGAGVLASAPQSQRNRVLEQQVQQQTQLQSQSSALESALNQVQNVFGISATSDSSSLTQLGTAINGLFSSLTALASHPSDTATREGVLSAASNLASTFNSTSAQLTSIGSALNSQAGALVGQANTLTTQIAALNQQISVLSPNGDAGVLEDQRQSAIEQLSQLVGLDQITTSANGIDLTTSNGAALVSGFTAYPLSTAVVNGQTQVYDGSVNTTGSSSNPASAALASVSGAATPGIYTVVVNSLATAATASSAVLTNPTSVLSGTLMIGTTTVSAANGNNTLSSLAQAINTANLGVTASVTTTASGSSLALTSPGTAGQTLLSGITNALTYTTLTNPTPTALALNAGATGADASLTVNGAAVSSPTNAVSTAIPGVTFNAIAPGTSTLQINAPITGGQLGGTLQALQQQLPAAESSIDALAYAIGSAVNTQNSAGVDANGNPGAALFTLGTTSSNAAATLAVATTDPQLVAAAALGEGSSGNTNASALAALAGTALLGTQTADQFLSSTLANIGNAAAAVTSDSTVQQASLTQLTTERDAYSAVSLDTEASNLTLYQRSYQAASQVFSIANTIMASAINMGVETAVS